MNVVVGWNFLELFSKLFWEFRSCRRWWSCICILSLWTALTIRFLLVSCWRSWHWRRSAWFLNVRSSLWGHRTLLSRFIHVIVCCFRFRLILPGRGNRSFCFLSYLNFIVRKLPFPNWSSIINWRSWFKMLLINWSWFLWRNLSCHEIFLNWSLCWNIVVRILLLKVKVSSLSSVAFNLLFPRLLPDKLFRLS
jgi:hypothetical protein